MARFNKSIAQTIVNQMIDEQREKWGLTLNNYSGIQINHNDKKTLRNLMSRISEAIYERFGETASSVDFSNKVIWSVNTYNPHFFIRTYHVDGDGNKVMLGHNANMAAYREEQMSQIL